MEYLNNIPKNRVVKVKNSPRTRKKNQELTNRGSRVKEIKVRNEIQQLFLNQLTYIQFIWINLKKKKCRGKDRFQKSLATIGTVS